MYNQHSQRLKSLQQCETAFIRAPCSKGRACPIECALSYLPVLFYKTSEEPPDMKQHNLCSFTSPPKKMPHIHSFEQHITSSDTIRSCMPASQCKSSKSVHLNFEFRPRRHFFHLCFGGLFGTLGQNSPSLMATAAKAPSKSPVSSLEKVDFLT